MHQSKVEWPRMFEPGEPGYDAAFTRTNICHRTHHVAGQMMEGMIAMHRPPGMKPGDSRYVQISDEYLLKRDSIPRHHTTPGASNERLPPGIRSGQYFMLDGGDATVRSIFGLHRYFLVFICVKSAKKIIVYLRSNNARSFVEAVLYVRRLVKVQLGVDLQGLYGDYFSTHRDTNTFGALREELSISMEVTPGYLHHLNPYVEGYIRIVKSDTRPRLKSLIGQRINDTIVKDASPWWDLAMEHVRQDSDYRPSHTLYRDMSVVTCPEAVWLNDLTFQADLSRMHPFGAVCHVLLEAQQRHWTHGTLERAYYMFNGRYNPFVHPGSTSPQSHVLLRSHNRLQVTGKVIFTYRDRMTKHMSTIVAPTPTDPTLSNDADTPTLPFAPLPVFNEAARPAQSRPDDGPNDVQTSWGSTVLPRTSALGESSYQRDTSHSEQPSGESSLPTRESSNRTPHASASALEHGVATPAPIPAPLARSPRRPPPSPTATTPVTAPTPPDATTPTAPELPMAPAPTAPTTTARAPEHAPVITSDATLRRSTREGRGQLQPDRATVHPGGGLNRKRKDETHLVGDSSQASTSLAPTRHSLLSLVSATCLTNLFALQQCLFTGGKLRPARPEPEQPTSVTGFDVWEQESAQPTEAEEQERILAAFAREFELSNEEYLKARDTLFTMMSQPRASGEPTRDSHYGENTDVNETIITALMDQLMFTEMDVEEVVLQIDYSDNTEYTSLLRNGPSTPHAQAELHRMEAAKAKADGYIDRAANIDRGKVPIDNSDRDLKLSLEEHSLLDLRGVTEIDKPRMLAAIAKEINDLVATGCFTVVEMPHDRKAIHSRIVLKVKYKADGTYEKHKARLVAKGFMEKLGSDFFSTYSPMASLSTARALMEIAVHYSLGIDHSDIPQAFIKAMLSNDVWLRLPPGVKLIDKMGNVHAIVKLVRSLYGLRAAPQHFNKVLVKFMTKCGFKQCVADTCLFSRKTDDGWVLVASEVDDLLITGTDTNAIAQFKQALIDEFSITDYGPISSFLGININYCKDQGELEMDVEYKIDHLFEKHQMLAGHLKGKADVAFLEEHANIPDDKPITTAVDKHILENYASLNGMLIYMGITCRPDITYALSKTSKGMHDPKPKHVAMLRQLLQYMYKSKVLCLAYSRDNPPMYGLLGDIGRSDAALSFVGTSDGQHVRRLAGFADANYANITDDERKSNTGYIFFMFGCAIIWRSKLQPITATSTHEAELIACAMASAEAIWCRKLLTDLGFVFELEPVIYRDDSLKAKLELDGVYINDEQYRADPLWLFNDNLGTTQTINNPNSVSPGIKHIDTRFFRIRQWVEAAKLRIAYVGTDFNVADFFTKGLTWPKFSRFRDRIGMRYKTPQRCDRSTARK